jgi:hypothetical protein
MRKTVIAAALAGCMTAVAGGALAYETLQGPTELRYWDQSGAYNGLTLFAASGTTYLIDMTGSVVHKWTKVGTSPHLQSDGSILDATKDDPSGFGGFQIVDWDGNVTWSYTEKRAGYSPHHDFIRVYNPKLEKYTVMYIANKTITNAEALAAGADPAKGPYEGSQMDTIVEVDMDGNVVWEWRFFDHVVQDYDPAKPNYMGSGKTAKDYPNRININMPGHPLKKDWLHCNSLDYNQALDQVVINSVHGEFYVIDHGGTFTAGDPAASIAAAAGSKGDFLYRFGDPARYGAGDPPSLLENWEESTAGHKQIGGAHDIQWIAPGLPGAGHFLIFNNAEYLFEHTPQSYIHEINPYLDSAKKDTGSYVNPPSAGYTVVTNPNKDSMKAPKNVSNQIVWTYNTLAGQAFFSTIGGSAQRLPNGNTLICSDNEGHFFEVTSAGKLVWEYINPVTKNGILTLKTDAYPMTNSVFRAYRYAVDNPAFSGKDLTPKGTITGTDPGQDGGAIITDSGTEPPDSGSVIADGGSLPPDAGSCPQTPCDCSGGGGGCNSVEPAGGGLGTILSAIILAAAALVVIIGRRGKRG